MLKRPLQPVRKAHRITVTLTNDEMISLRHEAKAMKAVDVETAAAALLTLGVTTNGFRRMRREAARRA